MPIVDRARQRLELVKHRTLSTLFRLAKRTPLLRQRIEDQMQSMMADLRRTAKPYRNEPRHDRLPVTGIPRAELLATMQKLGVPERARWHDGYVSGAVYHGDWQHIDFLNEVYALHSQVNPLHADLWPSVVKYEAEVVAMTANMLGAAQSGAPHEVCGAVTSGGTESILLAMKTYRDRARAEGIRAPEIVLPVTAHAAFDKAAQYFGMRTKKIKVDASGVVDVGSARRAIGRNTAVVVGSAPSFPHGAIDPIEELAEAARGKGVGCHVDACLGGFVLPWARRLGYLVPPFDFAVPGVTSISADTHKYGYAAKGTSVVLYRSLELRRFQWYTATDWPGGLYLSPTFAGSRPGALSAAAWAAMMAIGEDGYLEATRSILATAEQIKAAIRDIEGLRVIGDPLWVIAFASDELDIYRVLDAMTQRGWNLNGLHRPACVHLCVTLRHTQPGVADRFVTDLRASVADVRATPASAHGMAPIYGMAAAMPVRSAVAEMLQRYLDVLYEV